VRVEVACCLYLDSLTKAQNEDIVHQFMLKNGTVAELIPVTVDARYLSSGSQEPLTGAELPFRQRPGSIPHTIRFDPLISGTSGLFIARIRKRDAVSSANSVV